MQEFVVVDNESSPPKVVAGPFKSIEETLHYMIEQADRGDYSVTPVADIWHN